MAMNANVISFLNTVKKGMFTSSSKYAPSLFTMGVMYVGHNKLMRGAGKTVEHAGANIGLYRGLYTDRGDDIMASGKRGIDARSAGTAGLTLGLHKARRKY